MKFAITTLGCKVNSYESEAVSFLMTSRGHEEVDYIDFADVYVINTCMVTNTGEAKSRKMISRPLKINPQAILIVMGCLTQLKAEEILDMEGVKIVLGTSNREHIPDFLDEYLITLKKMNRVKPLEKEEPFDSLSLPDYKTHHRAFLKIEDGCNNFCTYCIIPFARGRVRSKDRIVLLKEAQRLAEGGHVELILTGIHTGGYGVDLKDYSFYDLLKDLHDIRGLKRLRISSIELSELTDEIIDLIAHSGLIVHHLHIPLQSGSNRILKLMNRKYTTEEYLNKLKVLREKIPSMAITTDIIVGFPSETEEDFTELLETVESAAFSEIHVFPYSKRSGTLASKMQGEVPSEIKKQRVHRLLEENDRLAKKYIRSQLHERLEMIAEKAEDGYLFGHTGNYIFVKAEGDPAWIGKPLPIELLEENYPISLAKIHLSVNLNSISII